ncbi:carboxypeptidase-like regulatory domain-containing protein [Kriegella aquimaris]|uniref:Tetratricopeptide repeat-containing protein n=1 Tax=Kriegella aquimaris TaxID=192904 RepID=A0A1G9QMP2_9FLAO|nr:carboxypeptidase-like regulatory domain-containing protein [Kriegella aquimaris]SDM12091.1 Tetratricopeptide repeat-containing protein [Kriegella aquimaris]
MKNWSAFLVLWFVVPFYAQTSEQTISGMVTDVWETPIPNVNILLKGTDRGTQTDESGWFSLYTLVNEVLVFSSLGYGSVEIDVPETGEELKIVLSPKATELDEVTLKKRKLKKQKDFLAEYPENANLIKTSSGVLDKDRSSSALRVINGTDLVAIGPDFLSSLKNFSPNMRVVRPPFAPDVEVYLFRIVFTSIDDELDIPPKAIFDVDGFIQETAPTYLSANDIDRVAILERNAAISRYGPRGTGGVIVVNTKATTQMDQFGVDKRYDNSVLHDSLSELFIDQRGYSPKPPDYMEAYGEATTVVVAERLLERDKELFLKNPIFFLDLADYFRKRWKDDKTSDMLLKEVRQRFPENSAVLRSLAYRYDILGRKNEALDLFLEILELDPSAAQSYYDLADVYAEKGNDKKASEVYDRYLHHRNNDSIAFDEYGADLMMTLESLNTLKPQKEKISWEKLEKEAGVEISRTRVLLTWSNHNINIGFLMASPESLYDTWTNTVKLNRLQNGEALRGYACAQFFLDDDPKGKWQLNLQHYEGADQEPTYLHISVFFDYGLPTRHRVLRLFKLTSEYEGTGLLTVNTQSGTVSD